MSKHEFHDIRVPIEENNPALKRIEGLCIKCGACKTVCEQEISIANHFSLEKTLDTAICIHCGQCINVCPTGALVEKQEWMEIEQAIHDPNKTVIAMTSPSVRVALQEEFGGIAGEYREEEMVGALRALGIDLVLDTTFAADLTIMEEASELLDRIQHNKPLPQFTSCCPAWVKFVETYAPERLPNLSSAKSPIGMFGPMIKTWYAKKQGIDPTAIVTVALTPCTAKKFEIRRQEMCDAAKETGTSLGPDTNHVITTRELANWMKAKNLDLAHITPSTYDSLMERGSGAGVIFGGTGGVMEAALRSAYVMLLGKTPPTNFLSFSALRGLDGIKTAIADFDGTEVKVAVIHGTDNARRFLDELKDDPTYAFVEVMTCRGGCIGGGGQPKHLGENQDLIREQRAKGLYDQDASMQLRYSHENPDIIRVYDEYLEKPLSSLAHSLLHTSYIDRSADLGEAPSIYAKKYVKSSKQEETKQTPTENQMRYKCTICGYIYEGDITKVSDEYKCPICFVPKEMFELVKDEVTEEAITTNNQMRYKCSVCGYIYEGDITKESDEYKCPICFVPKELFEKID